MFLRAAPGDETGFGTRAFLRPCSSNPLYCDSLVLRNLTGSEFDFLPRFVRESRATMNALKVTTLHAMPKKRIAVPIPDDFPEMFNHLLKHLDERFDRVDLEFKQVHGRFSMIDDHFREMFGRLDKMEFLLSGQDRRIATQEDRMRIVATKLGLEFRAKV
jgi:hypothetical protein